MDLNEKNVAAYMTPVDSLLMFKQNQVIDNEFLKKIQ